MKRSPTTAARRKGGRRQISSEKNFRCDAARQLGNYFVVDVADDGVAVRFGEF